MISEKMPMNRRLALASLVAISVSMTPAVSWAQARPAVVAAAQGFSSARFAAPQFKAAGGRELEIIRSLYAAYLDQNRSVAVETSLVDLQGRGVASVLTRFFSPEQPGSQFVLLHFTGRVWEPLLTVTGRTFEVQRLARGTAPAGWGTLVRVDGVVHEPAGGGNYTPTSWGTGTPLVSRSPARAVQPGMAPEGWFVEELPSPNGTLIVYREALFAEDRGSRVLVYLRSRNGNTAVLVMETLARGDRAAARITSSAMPEFLVDGQTGIANWHWDQRSSTYRVVGGR